MISDALQKWTVVIIILLGAVHPQMPMMPMGYGYGGPMMIPAPMPMPMPMPVPVPVGIPIPYPESTSTTTATTTTEANKGGGDNRIPIAIPIPMPHFVQIAFPSFIPSNCIPDKHNGNENRNKNCPPCPPCSCNPCTPSFFSFCSPCHLECRCKNGKENPIPQEPNAPRLMPGPAFPMPIPMPVPPPVVIVPFPPQFSNPNQPRPPRSKESDCDSRPASNSCSEDSSESGQSWRKKKRRKRKRKSKYDIYRRNFGGFMKRNRGDSGLVEPVLSYMSRNGDIKMKRRLSNDEARALLGERDPYNIIVPYHRADESYNNDVHLTAGEDSNNRRRIVVMSKPGVRNSHRRTQQVLDGQSQHLLGDGRKELVFKTPENKKISNLSVSFQISR